MNIEVVQKCELGEWNLLGYECIDTTGFKLVILQDLEKDINTNINISFTTPAINNKGTSHVIEHCIMNGMSNLNLLKINAKVMQNITSYHVLIEEFNERAIKQILDNILTPQFLVNPDIFYMEGWRVDEKRDLKGVVYNEVRSKLYDPIYTIVHQIPYTLYNETVFQNIAGGTLEDLLDLTYDEMILYFHKYYTISNCCISIHTSNNSIENIISVCNKVIHSFSLNLTQQEIIGKTKDIDIGSLINEFNMPFPDNNSSVRYQCINYATQVPRSQQEYNLYYTLRYEILNSITPVERSKVTILFENELFYAYFTIILKYEETSKNHSKKLIDKYQELIENIILKKNNFEIINFIKLDLERRRMEEFSKKISDYIVRAAFRGGDPFEYLRTKQVLSNRSMIQLLHKEFCTNKRCSIIKLTPSNIDMKEYFDKVKMKSLKKEIITNSFQSNRIECSTYSLKSGEITLNQPLKSYDKQVIHDNDIKYIIYSNKQRLDCIYFYFDITYLSEGEIFLSSLIAKYFLQEIVKAGLENQMKAYVYPLFSEIENHSMTYFVISMICSYDKLNEYLDMVYKILGKIEANIDAIKNVIEITKNKFELNRMAKLFVSIDFLSNFSLCSKHKNIIMGVDHYKKLSNFTWKEKDIIRIGETSKIILGSNNITISIYSESGDKYVNYLQNFFEHSNRNKSVKQEQIKLLPKCQAIIVPSDSNYAVIGNNLINMGYSPSFKYKILSKFITESFINPILRSKENVYGCELNIIENNICFLLGQTEKVYKYSQMLKDVGDYLEISKNVIINNYNNISKNYIYGSRQITADSKNDIDTLKILCKNSVQETNDLFLYLNDTCTLRDVELFIEIIRTIIKDHVFSILGNESRILENKIDHIMYIQPF